MKLTRGERRREKRRNMYVFFCFFAFGFKYRIGMEGQKRRSVAGRLPTFLFILSQTYYIGIRAEKKRSGVSIGQWIKD